MIEMLKTVFLRPVFGIGVAMMTSLFMTDKPIPDLIEWVTILTLVIGSLGWTNWRKGL